MNAQMSVTSLQGEEYRPNHSVSPKDKLRQKVAKIPKDTVNLILTENKHAEKQPAGPGSQKWMKFLDSTPLGLRVWADLAYINRKLWAHIYLYALLQFIN